MSVPVDGNILLNWMVTDAFYEPASPPYKTAYLPQDIAIAPGVFHIIHDIEFGGPRGEPWLEAAAMVALLIFLAEIGFVAITGIVRLVRHRPRTASRDAIARLAHPLAALAAVWFSVLMMHWDLVQVWI